MTGFENFYPPAEGIQGEQGEQGIPGVDGADSIVAGPQGDQGIQGEQGVAGNDGADSIVAGPKGDTGEQGIQGVAGIDGIDGEQGEAGNAHPISIASSVLLQGELALTGTVLKPTDATVLYTGNAATQEIVTGIGSKDLTYDALVTYSNAELSNLAFDRATMKLWKYISATPAAGVTPVEGASWTEVPDGEVQFWDSSKVHIKRRSLAASNIIADTLRGAGSEVFTDQTAAEATTDLNRLTGFTSSGFTIGDRGDVNSLDGTFVAYQTYYNKVMISTTNHGKRCITAFNDITKESMLLYKGSGFAGHELPHGLGKAPQSSEGKRLDAIADWRNVIQHADNTFFVAYTSAGFQDSLGTYVFEEDYLTVSDSGSTNFTDAFNMMYTRASSATRKIGTYEGTGIAGLKVPFGFQPSKVIIKVVNTIGNWQYNDAMRGQPELLLNLPDIEVDHFGHTYVSDGIILNTASATVNSANTLYYYEAIADTNYDGGGAYAELPTSASQVQITDEIVMYTNGQSIDGAVNTTEETVGPKSILPVGGWK
jgi:hypothetical protein